MGINAIVAEVIERCIGGLDLRERLAVVGVQDVEPEVLARRAIQGTPPAPGVLDRRFFEHLGFRHCDALEVSPSADIHLDLNELLPDDSPLVGAYDCLVDPGTLEHVFDIKSALFNLASLVRVGGHVLHMNPVQGYCNHGFFNLQPTLFYSFYEANGFDVCSCSMLEYLDDEQSRARLIPVPEDYNNLKLCTAQDSLIVVLARRREPRLPSQLKVPSQAFYRRIWEEKDRRQGGRLPDELYRRIVGQVPGNARDHLLESADYLE
ncbi:MAG TPA: hypothetical protein VK195_19200 [Burkholderiaceae bacterium]|nr:hypothetical protein [Burkholderiaceae bacterium]